ncbi:MAG: hypothetical protein EFKGCFLK_00613 [Rhodocyclaceae bacterium]|nr:DUF1631 domain-containing protein [Zoogloeaceae bacterium]MBV6407063.1 hypothetical protein [Rhodocyclaceae bacterium]MCK6382754.1 DUF1631 domain-containing protein [Rhodocyclaceae bacterium]CAG0928798.1 hypothetical protein RHDC3_00880 [Rhodocyclaceae bacterium]
MAASALNNVVNLNERRPPSAAESSRMLNDCRELAMKRLTGSLREMLGDIEEDLFRMAESSYDREMQNLYLEVRGKAKEKWPKVEVAFSRHFVDVFNHKMRGEMDTAMKTLAASTQELRLVEEDDLAESIATQELAARLREQNEDEWSLLGERVALLLGRSELKDEENPISPHAVCDALKRACDEIESSVRIKLVLLKQVEQHVSRALHGIYADLNSEMVRWNVLPELRSAYRRPVNYPAAPPQAARAEGIPPQPSRSEEAGGDLLAFLHQMMQVPRRGQPQQPAQQGAVPQGLTSVPDSIPAPDSRQVQFIDSLTEMQRLSTLMNEKGRVDGLPDLGQAMGTMNVLHQIRANGASQGIGQLDAITIDIVAMLFDFIFDDAKIPDAIKALVGRLQIPVLKVAMLDKGFFSSKAHPARRLLDGISRAALAWGDAVDQDDPLFKEIAFIVDRIQSDFERDVAVFGDALNLLNAVLAERDALAEDMAERSAEIMRRRETEEIAWIVAGEAVMRRLSSGVPQGVRRFLLDHWQHVLKELHIRHGEEHHAYLSATAMMDDLIWSVSPKTGSDERKQLVNTLPGLLRAMHHGLDVVNVPEDVRARFLDELVALHSAAVKAGLGGAEALAALPELEPDEATTAGPAAQYSVNPEGELFITRISENDVQIEEVALVGAAPSAATAGDACMQQVSALGRGDWVEFRQDEGQSVRARLSWVSPQRGLFLFTNPRSPRATSISQEALAYQFRTGLARIVTEMPMFERAVNGVLESLSVN